MSKTCADCGTILHPIQRMGGPAWSHGDFACPAFLQKEWDQERRDLHDLVKRLNGAIDDLKAKCDQLAEEKQQAVEAERKRCLGWINYWANEAPNGGVGWEWDD